MWQLEIGRKIRRQLSRIPLRDNESILAALDALCGNPHAGDVRKLGDGRYRLRVGAYRVFYALDFPSRRIVVSDVARRTSTTY